MARQEARRRPSVEEGGPLAIDYIFHPRSVAVVGASAPQMGPGGMGRGFIIAMQDMAFEGGLYPVNPRHQEILGLKCYPSVVDIPGPVDHVIFAVPARVVPEIIEDCIAKGVNSIHFFTAGFSETGEEEDAELERRIVSRAREAGIRLIGPNCMGIYCPAAKVAFMPEFPREPGPVGFLSQSGGNAGDMVYSAVRRGIRFSKVISYGNAADLNECDFLEYLAEDPETEIIVVYIEGVRDGPRFFRAMRRACELKPVIVLKGGRTEGGNRAAFSHTGSLAGSADVFSTLVQQVGAVRVDSVEELVDVTVAFRFLNPLPTDRGAAVVGVGGGYSVFAADEVNEAGLELPRLSESVQEELRQFTPVAGTSVRNPVDTLAMMNPGELTETVRIVAGDPQVDIILFHIALGWGPWRRMQGSAAAKFDPAMMVGAIADAVARGRDAAGKPVAAAARTPVDVEGMEHTLHFQESCWRNGLPVFLGIPRAANAIAKVIAWRERRETLSD